MILIHLLGDGTTLPKLTKELPIILLQQGHIFFGCFNKEKYCRNQFYLDEPLNMQELKTEIVYYVETECASLLHKKHSVHLLCPKIIAQKMLWGV
jgi:hypothetical protein